MGHYRSDEEGLEVDGSNGLGAGRFNGIGWIPFFRLKMLLPRTFCLATSIMKAKRANIKTKIALRRKYTASIGAARRMKLSFLDLDSMRVPQVRTKQAYVYEW